MQGSVAREFAFTRQDFDFLRRLASERTGIVVSDDKFSMFYSRLSRRLRALGLGDFKAYCELLQGPYGGDETVELINAITTNLTAFFRENHHFKFLSATVVPELLTRNAAERRVQVWSAGCSTGEEPYSIAMTLAESLPQQPAWDVRVHATDIDSQVLAKAASGIYPLERVEGLGPERLRRFLLRGKGAQAGRARVSSQIRSLVQFSQLNLMDDWRMPQVDLIFCRNVIIYFDKQTKQRLIERFAEVLPVGGYLFVGHSESLYKTTQRFELVGNTVYRKVG